MNTAFNDVIDEKYAELDLYPKEQSVRKEIDDQNDWVYNTVSLTAKPLWSSLQGSELTSLFSIPRQVNNVSRLFLEKRNLVHPSILTFS